jgi:hypothetical protein
MAFKNEYSLLLITNFTLLSAKARGNLPQLASLTIPRKLLDRDINAK